MHFNSFHSTVFGGIVQSFLQDSEEAKGDFLPQWRQLITLEVDLQFMLLAVFFAPASDT